MVAKGKKHLPRRAYISHGGCALACQLRRWLMFANISQVPCVFEKSYLPSISSLGETTLIMDYRIDCCICISLRWYRAWMFRISCGLCKALSGCQPWPSRIAFGLHTMASRRHMCFDCLGHVLHTSICQRQMWPPNIFHSVHTSIYRCRTCPPCIVWIIHTLVFRYLTCPCCITQACTYRLGDFRHCLPPSTLSYTNNHSKSSVDYLHHPFPTYRS